MRLGKWLFQTIAVLGLVLPATAATTMEEGERARGGGEERERAAKPDADERAGERRVARKIYIPPPRGATRTRTVGAGGQGRAGTVAQERLPSVRLSR